MRRFGDVGLPGYKKRHSYCWYMRRVLSNSFVKELDFDYVIIDEAAKATTPELLVSIIKAKKIVLVGDQNQLPAYADKELSPTIAKLTKDPSFRLFDILFNILPDSHKQVLTMQYRMIRNIGDLISQVFYQGKIATGVNDKDKLHPIKMFEGKSIIWIDTGKIMDKDEKSKIGGSYCNYAENTIIRKLLERMKSEGDLSELDMGTITGYKGQKELIKRIVSNNGYDKLAKLIDINTLDAFQGRENDVIVYSTVRTKTLIGFQKEKERVNVAFSRAKKLLIICGDLELYKKNLVYCSSDKCNLRPPGIAALQKLQVIQRKKDTLRNVYYDPFNRRIFEDVKNIQFQDRVRDDDKKLNVDFDQDRISIFRENINSINKVFSDEMDIYNDKTKAEPDELLSVDRIENVFVKFIRIPVYVYVSNSGKDIDILSANKALMGLFNEFKNEIIEQVRQNKLLKRIFYSYKIQGDFAIPNVETNDNIKKILTKRQYRNWDIGEREVFVEQEILKTRKLFHDEFDLLLKFLCDDSSLITISISHFDEWHNNALLNSILSIVGGHRLKAFYYNTCKQVDRWIKSIERACLKIAFRQMWIPLRKLPSP